MKMYISRTRFAFTLVELLVVVGILSLIIAIALPAIVRVRGLADGLACKNYLKQIGNALAQYNLSRKQFPPALMLWQDRFSYLNWHARLLPYLEDSNRWWSIETAFATEQLFWRGPHLPIRTVVLPVFNCPSDNRTLGVFGDWGRPAAFTHYLAVSSSKVGLNDGVMFPQSHIKPGEVHDGLSNTIVVGERPPSANGRFGWWYAGIGQLHNGTLDSHMSVRQVNQTFYAPTSPYGPYHFQKGDEDDMSSTFHFWSMHAGGAHFLFGDGSVRFLLYSADPVLPALASTAGKETINMIWD